MNVETVNIQAVPYLYVDGQAPMDPAQVSAEMERCFGLLMRFMGQNGIAPVGQPMSVYYGYDADTLAFRAGIPVAAADAAKADGDIKADQTPGGQVFSVMHVGPYSDLGKTYQAATAALAETGQSFGAPTWEIYIDDPTDTPADRMRTQIYSLPAG